MKYLLPILLVLLALNIQAVDLGQGIYGWSNCETNKNPLIQDCAPDTDSILQCVVIPEQGLCNIFNFQDTQSNLTVRFSLSNTTQLTIFNNEDQIWSQVTESSAKYQFEVTPQNNTLSVKLLSTNTTSLIGFQILNTTTIENCEEMDPSGMRCQMCIDDYYQYYGSCVQAACINQMMDEQIYLTETIDQNSFLIIDYSNTKNYSTSCSQYYVYLTQNFKNLRPIYYFKPVIRDNNMKLNLTLGNIEDYPIQTIVQDSITYYQFYLVMSHTVTNIIQSTYLSEVRLNFVAQTQEISYEEQTMDPNNPTFIVFSQQQIISLSQAKQNFTIEAVQQVLDPQYKDYTFQFKSADLQLNNVSTPVNLLNQTQLSDQSGTSYYFSFEYDQTGTINLSLSIETKLVDPQQSRRLLQSSSYQIEYKAKTISGKRYEIHQQTATQEIINYQDSNQNQSSKLNQTQHSSNNTQQTSNNTQQFTDISNTISSETSKTEQTQNKTTTTTLSSIKINLTKSQTETSTQSSRRSQKSKFSRKQDSQTGTSVDEVIELSYLPLIIILSVLMIIALIVFVWRRKIQKIELTSTKVNPKLDITKPVISINEDPTSSTK